MAEQDRRKHLRFDPESNSLCIIESAEDKRQSVIGLLRDRSKSGCAAVFHEQDFSFDKGDELVIQPGSSKSITSELIWSEQLDDKFVKAGFEFNESI